MTPFLSATQKINLECPVSMYSGSPTVSKNCISVTTLHVFVFDKTYHPVLSDSALVHPKSATSVHLKVHFFEVYFLVSCFPAISLKRTKLKCGTMKLKAYERII